MDMGDYNKELSDAALNHALSFGLTEDIISNEVARQTSFKAGAGWEKKRGIGLNDAVIVTVTAEGAKHLNVYYGYYAKKYPFMCWKTDYKEGDDFKTSLWDIIGIFAEYGQAGKEITFSNLRHEM